ncbi:helix-turn-helix domain-containing protein [Kurthia sibirica]|nr:helix-turn-helix transcriptional regulator [Kurthia sibirica]GEK34674.1 hypothetical protein KSI01_22070 [Kurthia sibirica]
MMTNRLGDQLKEIREEKKITLEELSLKTRVGSEKLARYESGEEVPSEATLLKLSNALEIPISNLMDGLK